MNKDMVILSAIVTIVFAVFIPFIQTETGYKSALFFIGSGEAITKIDFILGMIGFVVCYGLLATLYFWKKR